jgi:hypothetical protein
MGDLLAGTTVQALDTPITVQDSSVSSFTFNSTSYGVDADSGAYEEVGVAFVACTTGRALVHTLASVDRDTAATFTACAPAIRTGGTIGAGTVHTAAADINGVFHFGTDAAQFGATCLISGLTPGDTYNVRLEHRVGGGGGTGTIQQRAVIVTPCS